MARRAPWWMKLSMIILVGLMVSLGFWQLDRSQQKRLKLERFDLVSEFVSIDVQGGQDLERYRRVSATGRYRSERQIIMDGLSANKQAGYMVLTPMELESGVVMVNRGWRPWRTNRDEIEDIDVDDQMRTITGRIDNFWQPGLVLGQGNQEESEDWPRLSVYPQAEEINRWLDQEVMQYQILLAADEADGFRRDWRPAGISPERHLGYAMQWFAMAIALVILLIVSSRATRGTGHD